MVKFIPHVPRPWAAGLIAMWAASSQAAPVRVANKVDDPGRLIKVNNVAVARLVSGSGSLSLEERAAIVETRLKNLASTPGTPSFRVERRKKQYWVTLNGGYIACPTSEDAAFVSLDRKATAQRWAARLKQAWQTPLLRLSPSQATVGIDAAHGYRIAGAAEGPIQVSLEPAGIGGAALDTKTGVIRVTGRSPGRATLRVTRDGVSVASAVRVMAWAGTVSPLTVEVTGRSVPRDLLREQVSERLKSSVHPSPGCWYRVLSRPSFPATWSRGDALQASIPVRLTGPGHLPVDRTIPVTIKRVTLPAEPPVSLFYSNKPESVRQAQVLFRQRVTPDSPARLLYHHQNKSSKSLDLMVDIVNEGKTDARVQVVEANGPVSIDAVQAGHDAATTYMRRYLDGAGAIITIPPGARRTVAQSRLARQETASGLLGLRPLDGGPVLVDVRAQDSVRELPSIGNTALATAVFPSPDKTLHAEYTVGGQWLYVPIGQLPVSNGQGAALDGNYGVFYTLRLKIINPTAAPAKVRIAFEPRAGAAQGAFVIDGMLVKIRRAYPPQEPTLRTVVLKAHETRTVSVVTMPAAGGSYPASIIVNGL